MIKLDGNNPDKNTRSVGRNFDSLGGYVSKILATLFITMLLIGCEGAVPSVLENNKDDGNKDIIAENDPTSQSQNTKYDDLRGPCDPGVDCPPVIDETQDKWQGLGMLPSGCKVIGESKVTDRTSKLDGIDATFDEILAFYEVAWTGTGIIGSGALAQTPTASLSLAWDQGEVTLLTLEAIPVPEGSEQPLAQCNNIVVFGQKANLKDSRSLEETFAIMARASKKADFTTFYFKGAKQPEEVTSTSILVKPETIVKNLQLSFSGQAGAGELSIMAGWGGLNRNGVGEYISVGTYNLKRP